MASGMSIERFFKKYPKYGKFKGNETFEKMYKWLSNPERIYAMKEACLKSRPALEGIVQDFEQEFGSQNEVPLEGDGNLFNRQMIGAVIKEILFDFGFIQTHNGRLATPIQKYFRSATHYKYHEEFATKKLSITVIVEQIKEPLNFVDSRNEILPNGALTKFIKNQTDI